MECIIRMECKIHTVRTLTLVALSLCCFLLHAQTGWGDSLLTLKNGLQIRAQAYRVDASTIQIYTESGSMTLPADIVVAITADQFPSSLGSRPSATPNPAQVEDEQTHEKHLDPRRHRPLYIPDEKSPHE